MSICVTLQDVFLIKLVSCIHNHIDYIHCLGNGLTDPESQVKVHGQHAFQLGKAHLPCSIDLTCLEDSNTF